MVLGSRGDDTEPTVSVFIRKAVFLRATLLKGCGFFVFRYAPRAATFLMLGRRRPSILFLVWQQFLTLLTILRCVSYYSRHIFLYFGPPLLVSIIPPNEPGRRRRDAWSASSRPASSEASMVPPRHKRMRQSQHRQAIDVPPHFFPPCPRPVPGENSSKCVTASARYSKTKAERPLSMKTG